MTMGSSDPEPWGTGGEIAGVQGTRSLLALRSADHNSRTQNQAAFHAALSFRLVTTSSNFFLFAPLSISTF